MLLVGCIALRLNIHCRTVVAHNIGESPIIVLLTVSIEIFAEIKTGKRHRSASVLFFDLTAEIRRIAKLRFHFLLAVAVIVVGDQCDNDTFFITTRQLEWDAVIVFFIV